MSDAQQDTLKIAFFNRFPDPIQAFIEFPESDVNIGKAFR
jgi:hypothetical protein